jgi:hypothetical protein
MTEQRHDEQAPLPTTVAAWFVLGVAPTERVPWWAAQWLADGHDGPALRELAGLNGRDPHAVNDLLPGALADLGLTLPSTTVAAASEEFRRLAEMCLAGRAGERWVAQQVEEIVIRVNYNDEVIDLARGQLYGTEDAWQGGWGPPVEELKATVRDCCAAQLRATEQ